MKFVEILKSFFIIRPYKFITILNFSLFSILLLQDIEVLQFSENLFHFFSFSIFLIIFLETIYFLRFYKKSKVSVKVKSVIGETREVEILNKFIKIFQASAEYFFFALWSSVPLGISFFLSQIIGSINFTNFYEKIILILVSSFLLTMYLKSVEKITMSKDFEFLSQGWVSIVSVFAIYLGVLFVFDKFWIVNFSFKVSFLLSSGIIFILYFFLLHRIATTKEMISYQFLFFLFLLIEYFLLKKIQEFRVLTFVITVFSFLLINFSERRITKTLSGTIFFLYLMILLGLLPIFVK
ncbi:MAG: hypothetical protein Fur0024_5310 [Patescibacteria group bacterium]